ncbi:hypothetical protein DFJ77DRAFT_444935 [Powellomyces hirtus]|nr:hypothetical protein DFJ77DRAFT_444935 [Powellomyces hirtus]
MSPPPQLTDLPHELLIAITHHLPLSSLYTFARLNRTFQTLVSSHATTIFRPRLAAYDIHIDIPTHNKFNANANTDTNWEKVLRDVVLWKDLEQVRSTPGMKCTEQETNNGENRRFFAAVSGAAGGPSARIVHGGTHVCIISTSTIQTLPIYPTTPPTPDARTARTTPSYAKWIDSDTPHHHLSHSSDSYSYMAINEWRGAYEGGYTRIFDTTPTPPRQVFAGKVCDTPYIAVTCGDLLACATAWWSLPEPRELENGIENDTNTGAVVTLYKINPATPPTKIWSYPLPRNTRPRTLTLSPTHLYLAIDSTQPHILSLPLHTPTNPTTIPTSSTPISLHIVSTILLAQTPGEITLYTHNTRFATICIGDVLPLVVAFNPTTHQPLLVVLDLCHPERVCIVTPRTRTSRWVVAPPPPADGNADGLWCLFGKEHGEINIFKYLVPFRILVPVLSTTPVAEARAWSTFEVPQRLARPTTFTKKVISRGSESPIDSPAVSRAGSEGGRQTDGRANDFRQ